MQVNRLVIGALAGSLLVGAFLFTWALVSKHQDVERTLAGERAKIEQTRKEGEERYRKEQAANQAARQVQNRGVTNPPVTTVPNQGGSDRVPAPTTGGGSFIFGFPGMQISVPETRAPELSATPATENLRFLVQDEQGKAVPYAVCRLFDPSKKTFLQRLSDESGRCTFSRLAVGPYTMEVITMNGRAVSIVVSVPMAGERNVIAYPSTPDVRCSDSDFDNIYQAGTVRTQDTIHPVTNDYCYSGRSVMEFSCMAAGASAEWPVEGKLYECPGGCSNGACQP